MSPRRILLLGEGDLTEETAEALRAADAQVVRLEDPTHEELNKALDDGADAVLVVSRHDAWPLRAALLVRHIDEDVPIVVTIFEPETARELESLIGNCTVTSLADIVAPVACRPMPRRGASPRCSTTATVPSGCAVATAPSRSPRCPRCAPAGPARSSARS